MNENNGVGLATVVFVVFLTLKLVGSIEWSWWWVFSPLWLVAGFWAVCVVLLVLLTAFGEKETW